MKVERIDHIHFAVNDLDRAIKLLSEILGTKFCQPEQVDRLGMKTTICHLGLEVMQPTSEEGPIAKHIKRRGEGIQGISFKVSNIEEAVAELQSRGMTLVGRVEVGGLKEAQFHPKDSYGVMIELAEYEDEHPVLHASRCKEKSE